MSHYGVDAFYKDLAHSNNTYYNQRPGRNATPAPPTGTALPVVGTWGTTSNDFQHKNGHRRMIKDRNGRYWIFYQSDVGDSRRIRYRSSSDTLLWTDEATLELSPARQVAALTEQWDIGYLDGGVGNDDAVYVFVSDRNQSEKAVYYRGVIGGVGGTTITWGVLGDLGVSTGREDPEFTSTADGNQGTSTGLLHVVVHHEVTATGERKWAAVTFDKDGTKVITAADAIFVAGTPTNSSIGIAITHGSGGDVLLVAAFLNGNVYRYYYTASAWNAPGAFVTLASTTSGYQVSMTSTLNKPYLAIADGLNGARITVYKWLGLISAVPTSDAIRLSVLSQMPSITRDGSASEKVYVYCKDDTSGNMRQVKEDPVGTWTDTELGGGLAVDTNIQTADPHNFGTQVIVGYDTISGFDHNINLVVV